MTTDQKFFCCILAACCVLGMMMQWGVMSIPTKQADFTLVVVGIAMSHAALAALVCIILTRK